MRVASRWALGSTPTLSVQARRGRDDALERLGIRWSRNDTTCLYPLFKLPPLFGRTPVGATAPAGFSPPIMRTRDGQGFKGI